MGMGSAIKSVFVNYMNFEGRARRSEFWYFSLFSFLVSCALAFLFPINIVWSLAVLVPSLAVTWRRLHDIGKSGAYAAFALIPIVGAIFLIIWCTEDSQPGDNQYGKNPKGEYGAQQPYSSAAAPVADCLLAVQCLSGPLQGQVYRLSRQGLTIGTEVGCTIRFPAGTPGVSRRHCEIVFQQGVPVLTDLGSSYGTTLADGKRLPPHYPERISAGTRFYVGSPNVVFQIINV